MSCYFCEYLTKIKDYRLPWEQEEKTCRARVTHERSELRPKIPFSPTYMNRTLTLSISLKEKGRNSFNFRKTGRHSHNDRLSKSLPRSHSFPLSTLPIIIWPARFKVTSTIFVLLTPWIVTERYCILPANHQTALIPQHQRRRSDITKMFKRFPYKLKRLVA